LSTGDSAVIVQFIPRTGQTQYGPNGAVYGGLLTASSSGWQINDASNLCEVTLSELTFASAASVCDGELSGVFRCLYTGNTPVSGGFIVPLSVAQSQIANVCAGTGDNCSSNADCCSQSCSPVGLGCN